MPRRVLARRYWDRIVERRRRLKVGVRAAYYTDPAPPEFIDYWASVPATYPEKLVFAELARRGVSFYFSYLFGDIPFTPDKEERYRPDFILPDYKVIIEVAGAYWHTRPGMWEYDIVKLGLYEAAGWKVFIFTDLEILMDVAATIDEIPGLANPAVRGGRIMVGDRPINPKAAIVARIKKWPKVVRTRYKSRRKGIVRAFKPSGKVIGKPAPATEMLVTHKTVDEEYLEASREFGKDWFAWLAELGVFYIGHPRNQRDYPEYYDYWLKWKDWDGGRFE